MPSARGPFTSVQIGPDHLESLGFQFISVHQHSLAFNSTAEVTAEVNPLRAVQDRTVRETTRGRDPARPLFSQSEINCRDGMNMCGGEHRHPKVLRVNE